MNFSTRDYLLDFFERQHSLVSESKFIFHKIDKTNCLTVIGIECLTGSILKRKRRLSELKSISLKFEILFFAKFN